MLDATQSLAIVKIALFVFIILSACIYSIPIILLRRFHTPINILTVNVGINCIICSVYWIMYSVLQIIYSDDLMNWNCVYFQYFQTFVNCQEVYALCNVTINRFCIILYNNKLLFKTRRWVFACIAFQVLLGVVLPLPIFSMSDQPCGQINQAVWLRIYILLIVLIGPSVLFVLINTIILVYTHSSSRRVAPSNTTNQVSLVNKRDTRLVKRVLILFSLFLIGWGPVYILVTIESPNNLLFELIKLLPELSLLGEVINLFLYNQKVWLYIKQRFLHFVNILHE